MRDFVTLKVSFQTKSCECLKMKVCSILKLTVGPLGYISKMESSNPIIHWSYRQEIKIQADRRNDIVFEDFHRIEKLEGRVIFFFKVAREHPIDDRRYILPLKSYCSYWVFLQGRSGVYNER